MSGLHIRWFGMHASRERERERGRTSAVLHATLSAACGLLVFAPLDRFASFLGSYENLSFSFLLWALSVFLSVCGTDVHRGHRRHNILCRFVAFVAAGGDPILEQEEGRLMLRDVVVGINDSAEIVSFASFFLL